MRRVLLRYRLFLLAAAGIVPLAVMAGLALWAFTQHQRTQAERAGIETARALMTAVDGALDASTGVLRALASLVPTDPANLPRYHALLKQVVATQPMWIGAKLADPMGTQRLHTRYPVGAELPEMSDAPSFFATVKTRRPVAGSLVRRSRGRPFLPVRVPVLHGEELLYVLSAEVSPESILGIVERQRLPGDWDVSVFDPKRFRVARSRLHDRYLGQSAPPTLQALMDYGGDEGYGLIRSPEGGLVYTAYSRSRSTRWSVAIGIPPSVVEAGAFRSRLTFGGGVLVSVSLAVLAALLIGRSIAVPMRDLREAALALGEGRSPRWPDTPIREIHEVAATLATAATEQVRHAAERERILRREQAARALAESANRAKDEFLAMLGHELRNPLGAIANARQVLDHPGTDATMAAHARAVIGRQVDHLSRMTDDLLDVTRAMTGKIILQRRPVDLASAVAHALVALRAACAPIHQRIVEALEPVWVDADPTRLEQIIMNLIGNAVKFTPPGGKIDVSVRRVGGEGELRVTDDGIGMPSDLTPRVFDPFVQGERGLDRSQGGLGLGLTLVRRLAELHGGTASARSEGPNRGSEFVVRLPAIPQPPQQADPPPVSSVLARNILIVDDDGDARESLRVMLELQGHRVRAAADADSALSAIRGSVPDVAIIDIGLPIVDGYQLVGRIGTELGADERPLLVALTGYGLPADLDRSAEAGFDVHLVKPVSLAELESVLRRALPRSGSATRASG